MRSANHIIDQARFSEHGGFDEQRKGSFDYSIRSETSYKKKPQATAPDGRLFDLEDEDNMH